MGKGIHLHADACTFNYNNFLVSGAKKVMKRMKGESSMFDSYRGDLSGLYHRRKTSFLEILDFVLLFNNHFKDHSFLVLQHCSAPYTFLT